MSLRWILAVPRFVMLPSLLLEIIPGPMIGTTLMETRPIWLQTSAENNKQLQIDFPSESKLAQLPPQPPSLSPFPEIEPSPTLPSPQELLQPSSGESQENPGAIPQTTIVKRFEIVGSTVFRPEELAEITQPFTNRPISLAELYQVRSAITQLYTERGYINSGAFLPPQELLDGTVTIQVIEGGVERINITGTQRLRESYIRDRLAIATTSPLNINRLLQALQLLQLNPLIENISSELSASPRPGLSLLDIEVIEADSFEVRLFADNKRTPSVGSFRRGVGLTQANLLGFGDSLRFDYANTDGSDNFDFNYTFPLNARNGTLSLIYGTGPSEVISAPFDVLDIESDSRYYELTFRQPIIQTPAQELIVGITGSHQASETTLLGQAFPVSLGADDEGNTSVSAIRLFQEWINRDQASVLALRSQFSVGVDAFNATVNSGELPDTHFFSWRFQGQWVRLLAEDMLLLLRTDVQIASEPLLSLEQFRFGGLDSVRGYPQDTLLTDNGVFVSAEVRLPILRVSQWDGILHLTPFIDYGRGWNDSGIDPDPDYLGSFGLGLQWQQGRSLSIRAGLGFAWNEFQSLDRTWFEDRVYFSVIYTPF